MRYIKFTSRNRIICIKCENETEQQQVLSHLEVQNYEIFDTKPKAHICVKGSWWLSKV